MNAGAARASGSHLVFLHGDTRVCGASLTAMVRSVARHPERVHAWSLAFDRTGWRFRWLERAAAWRDRIRHGPPGDQGPVVPRRRFMDMGGFADEPLLEDVDVLGRMRREGAIHVNDAVVTTSAERFERRGFWRTLFSDGPAGRVVVGLLALVVTVLLGSGPVDAAIVGAFDDPPDSTAIEEAAPDTVEAVEEPEPFVIPEDIDHPDQVDHTHARFDSVLARFVDERGRVNYAELTTQARTSASSFRIYLYQLGTPEPEEERAWTRDQRLAYWINAYNAFTLKLITDHYPIRARWYMNVFFPVRLWVPANSIVQIPGRWDEITWLTARGEQTLDAIEHEILRPEFADPRIHFAIVCASIGCSKLARHAYHPDRLDAELNAATTAFMSDPMHVRWEPGSDRVEISKIFEWFRSDFNVPPAGGRPVPEGIAEGYGKDAGVVRWLVAYGPDALAARLREGPVKIKHLGYDWGLNEWVLEPSGEGLALEDGAVAAVGGGSGD